DDKVFATQRNNPRYRQLRMDAVEESSGKTFAEQESLLSAEEEVPSARSVVMGVVLHFLATQQHLFPDCYVRCADKYFGGYGVCVGDFDRDGLRHQVRRVAAPANTQHSSQTVAVGIPEPLREVGRCV